MTPVQGRTLQTVLDQAWSEGVYSALVGLVGTPGGIDWVGGAGTGSFDPGACRFDLASLTKPWVGSLALALDRTGRLPLGEAIGAVLPEVSGRLGERTLESLLRHRAGLAPWAPLYALGARTRAAESFWRDPARLGAAPDTYSDLGFILWGLAAQRVTGEDLHSLLSRSLFEPWGVAVERGAAGAQPAWRAGTVPCWIDTGKERELAAGLGLRIAALPPPRLGETQDGNARSLGGLAGHAGLFGSARDVWRLGAAWLGGEEPLGASRVESALAGEGIHRLGWRCCAGDASVGGSLDEGAFGHLGFTGGGVWVDRRRGRIRVLLGHRRSPVSDLAPVRRAFNLACRAAGY